MTDCVVFLSMWHGELSRGEAEALVTQAGGERGAYLVRASSDATLLDPSGQYRKGFSLTLFAPHARACLHYRVVRRGGAPGSGSGQWLIENYYGEAGDATAFTLVEMCRQLDENFVPVPAPNRGGAGGTGAAPPLSGTSPSAASQPPRAPGAGQSPPAGAAPMENPTVTPPRQQPADWRTLLATSSSSLGSATSGGSGPFASQAAAPQPPAPQRAGSGTFMRASTEYEPIDTSVASPRMNTMPAQSFGQSPPMEYGGLPPTSTEGGPVPAAASSAPTEYGISPRARTGLPNGGAGPSEYDGMPTGAGPGAVGGAPAVGGDSEYGGMPVTSDSAGGDYGGMPPPPADDDEYGGMPVAVGDLGGAAGGGASGGAATSSYGGMPPGPAESDYGGMPPPGTVLGGRAPPAQQLAAGGNATEYGGMPGTASDSPGYGGLPPPRAAGGGGLDPMAVAAESEYGGMPPPGTVLLEGSSANRNLPAYSGMPPPSARPLGPGAAQPAPAAPISAPSTLTRSQAALAAAEGEYGGMPPPASVGAGAAAAGSSPGPSGAAAAAGPTSTTLYSPLQVTAGSPGAGMDTAAGRAMMAHGMGGGGDAGDRPVSINFAAAASRGQPPPGAGPGATPPPGVPGSDFSLRNSLGGGGGGAGAAAGGGGGAGAAPRSDIFEVQVGDNVEILNKPKQGTGEVMWIGKLPADPKKKNNDPDKLWVGIKYSVPSGKNDGTYQGVRCFSCPKRHGLFVPLAEIASKVLQSGYLVKKGSKNPRVDKWQRRWVELKVFFQSRAGFLQYYKNVKEKPRGIIAITKSTRISDAAEDLHPRNDNPDVSFSLYIQQRQFWFVAKDPAKKNLWVAAIRSIIQASG